jgi:hypothetical protein
MISVGGRVTGSVLIDEGGLAAVDEAEIGAGVAAASASQNGGQNGQNEVSEAAGHWGTNGQNGSENSGVEGVTAPAQRNSKTGRFLPGNSGNPTGWAKRDIKVLHEIHAAYPPERIIGLLDEALDVARSHQSYRGIVEVARLVIEYTVGKPVQRSITVSSKMDSILTRLESIQVVDGSVLDEAGDEGE